MTSKAWSVSILAAFHEGVPGRQAPLLTATGAGRTSFAQSLNHLIEIGLAERNPGYGHPLRPEFRLTEEGVTAAKLAHQIQLAGQEDGASLLRRSWTVPILATLQEPLHFGGIKTGLVKITDRALSQSLKLMGTANWIAREVSDEMWPPRPIYRPVNAGEAIADVIASQITFQLAKGSGPKIQTL